MSYDLHAHPHYVTCPSISMRGDSCRLSCGHPLPHADYSHDSWWDENGDWANEPKEDPANAVSVGKVRRISRRKT